MCVHINTSGHFILLLSGHFRGGQTILNTESEASRAGRTHQVHQTKPRVSYVNTSLALYSMCFLRLTKLTKAKKTALYVFTIHSHTRTCTHQEAATEHTDMEVSEYTVILMHNNSNLEIKDLCVVTITIAWLCGIAAASVIYHVNFLQWFSATTLFQDSIGDTHTSKLSHFAQYAG